MYIVTPDHEDTGRARNHAEPAAAPEVALWIAAATAPTSAAHPGNRYQSHTVVVDRFAEEGCSCPQAVAIGLR